MFASVLLRRDIDVAVGKTLTKLSISGDTRNFEAGTFESIVKASATHDDRLGSGLRASG